MFFEGFLEKAQPVFASAPCRVEIRIKKSLELALQQKHFDEPWTEPQKGYTMESQQFKALAECLAS